ncbi:MAG: FtsX-like permease family protein [Scrofimicrobium sp.]
MDSHQKMYGKMIGRSFLRRFSRVMIASLAIAVGAATLSGLGIVAYTVPKQMQMELRSYGANMIVLPGGPEGMSQAEVEAAVEGFPDALGHAAYQYTNLLYNQQALSVMGVNFDDVQQVRPYWEITGDVPTKDNQILIGDKVAEQYRFRIGDTVGLTEPTVVDGTAKNLKVSGILHTGGAEDELVIMSPEVLEEFTGTPSYSLVEFSLNADQDTLTAAAEAFNEANPNMDAEVVRRVSESETGIANTLSTLILIVTAIISLLTIISISATLNAVVSERAKEIGLKKALGALSGDIMREFLGEAVVLGTFGGLIGSGIGIWIADYLSMQAFAMRVQVPWWIIPLTLVFSIAIAVIGSLGPARRISRIKPVDVLGGE